MKKIKVRQLGIAAILLLCAVFCQGQNKVDSLSVKDTSLFITTGWGTGYSDSVVSVTKWQDGRFEIKGDTLAAIKLLWLRLEETQKREYDLWGFIVRAVDFTNTVPDYLKNSKNNKTWLKYYSELKKLGYKVVSK